MVLFLAINGCKVTENHSQKQILEQRIHKYLFWMLSRDKILRSENKLHR